MKPTRLFALMLLTCFSTIASAQYSSCIVTFTTTVNNRPLVLKSNSGVLTFNTKSGDLTLTVNTSTFINEVDTFNAVVFPQNDNIMFTGKVQQDMLQVVNPQSSTGKTFPVIGTLAINTQQLQMVANYSALKINNSRDDLTKNLKMSLFLPFSAKSARLNKYYPAATGDAIIQVVEGTTNIIEE
jgi:hypothetical protein